MRNKLLKKLVHKIPADLRKILDSDPATRKAWEDITPLARNEWICWIESVKKQETRNIHLNRTRTELKEGKRRPCCWAGCRHTATARLRTVAPIAVKNRSR